MIHQDGSAQKETAKNTDSIKISGINVTETNPDRMLVVCFAAKGHRVGSARVNDVTYNGDSMMLSAEAPGVFDSQFGGTWIYTLLNPKAGADVVISFHDLIADEIAAVATVFHGVDQTTPIGRKEGIYARAMDIQVSPISPESRYLSVMASGVKEENRFVPTASTTEVLAMLEVEDMSLNVAISEAGGGPNGDIGVSFSDDRSRNAVSMVEMIPTPQVALRIVEIGINETSIRVAEGTTRADGTKIRGLHGIMTIGADGSYDYLVDEEAAAKMAPTDAVTEEFTYQLSNATRDVLVVDVKGEELEPVPEDDVTPTGSEVEALAVTHVNFAEQPPLPVQLGTTSKDGTQISGRYGTLTIGADGSYSYITDQKEAEKLSPADTVEEHFSYVLSNGKQSTKAKLPVVVTGVNQVTDPVEAAASPEPVESFYEITEIAAGDSRTVAVTSGSTLTDGPTEVPGLYGTLIIGADGSYEYVVNESLSGSELIAPVEMFNYTLSNGINQLSKTLPISVAVPEATAPAPPVVDETPVEVASYDEDDIEIEYAGQPQEAPLPEEKEPEPAVSTLDVEEAERGFIAPDMIVSSGTMTSFSDFSNVQYTAEVEMPEVGSSKVASTENSTISRAPTLLSTMAGGEVPSPKRVTPAAVPKSVRNEALAGAGALPLEGITKLFRGPKDPRFFSGRKVQFESNRVQSFFFLPFFAGAASPGASVVIIIRDSLGIEVSMSREVAEMSGTWTSSPEIQLEDGKYTITIEETPATWGNAAFPARSLVAEISGGGNLSPQEMRNLREGQILGEVLVGRSLEEHVSDHAASADDPNLFSEIK